MPLSVRTIKVKFATDGSKHVGSQVSDHCPFGYLYFTHSGIYIPVLWEYASNVS